MHKLTQQLKRRVSTIVVDNRFPVFKPFTEKNYKAYQEFVFPYRQHCDFTLNNLLVWLGGDTNLSYSWLNGNCVIQAKESLYQSTNAGPQAASLAWYTIVGDTWPDKSLASIFATGQIKQLLMVPDYFVEKIKRPEKYVITEDTHNRDYIIDVDKLLQSKGQDYGDFRYQINYFLRKYSEHAVLRELDLSNSADADKIRNCLNGWPRINSFESTGNDPDRLDAQAIEMLLKLQPKLPIKHQCLGLFIEDTLQGFSIFHIPYAKDRIAMGNHIKFNGTLPRLFDFLVYATASKLRSQGVHILNAEQDMGIEGIRHHKTILNPFTFYKKYSITPR
jgi:hypothetical protein